MGQQESPQTPVQCFGRPKESQEFFPFSFEISDIFDTESDQNIFKNNKDLKPLMNGAVSFKTKCHLWAQSAADKPRE